MTETSAVIEGVSDFVNEILPLTELREDGKAELFDILTEIRGRKCLVIEKNLEGIIHQVVTEGSTFLKDNGVQYVRELKGALTFSSSPPENIIYLVRPDLPQMKLIGQQIRESTSKGFLKCEFNICFVPTQSTVCMHLLEAEINNKQIFDRISFGECRLGLIPYDSDVLSLEFEGTFKECNVDGDNTSLTAVALAIQQMQSIYGLIPNIKGKGTCSKKVLQKLLHLRVEEGAEANERQAAQKSEIDTLIVIDREVDLVSPIVTPLTYEGLLDDFIGINNSRIRVDAAVVAEQDDLLPDMNNFKNPAGQKMASPAPTPARQIQPGEKATVTLTNNDQIYKEIRDLSIEKLGAVLQEKVYRMKEHVTSYKDIANPSLEEMHGFVKKLKVLKPYSKSLTQHINIAQLVKTHTDSKEFRDQWQGERGMLEGESYLDDIEELLCADFERTKLYKILRLICLQSITAGGIRSARYDTLRKMIGHNYGVDAVLTMVNFEKVGLIKHRKELVIVDTTVPLWQVLRKQLKLIDEDTGDQGATHPDDISYVTKGYAPLLVRLVQRSGTNTWAYMNDTLKLLPGPLLEFTQNATAEELSEAIARSARETGVTINNNSTSNTATSSVASHRSSIASTTFDMLSYTTNITSNIIASATSDKFSEKFSEKSNATNATNRSGIRHDTTTSTTSGYFDFSEKKVMFVFVIGGLSYLEIAAFRFLSKDPTFPYKIVVGTTKLVNGSTFLQSMEHSFV